MRDGATVRCESPLTSKTWAYRRKSGLVLPPIRNGACDQPDRRKVATMIWPTIAGEKTRSAEEETNASSGRRLGPR